MSRNTAHEYEVRESTNRVVDASRKLLDTDRRQVQRDQHPKQHGCVRARFVIGKDLGEAFRQGLFQREKVYDAWIRLSNGKQSDDRKPDAHGMAVKLMGVEGPKVLADEASATTQDFVLIDSPTFFLRDAVAYGEFSDVLLKAAGKKSSGVYSALGLIVSGPVRGLLTLFLLSLFRWKLGTFLRLIKFAGKRIANPVTTRYWSSTPYRFGNTCMKFSAVPAEFPGGPPAEGQAGDSYDALAEFLRPAVAATPAAARPKGDSPDYLRQALSRTLAVAGTAYLFQVQLFKDEETTPIDDPTVEWPEDAVPFHTVARIWIPKQVFDSSAQMAFGENLTFTPWHAMPAHEPLGEINDMRKDVYSKLSALRHRLNGVEQIEPAPGDPDPANVPARWGNDSSAFCHVLEDELDLIEERRRHVEDGSAAGRDGRHPRPSADGAADQTGVAIDGRADADGASGASGVPTAPRDVDGLTRQARLRAAREQTTGLALAGGGPRGAAFAVGFLQGLASLALIRRFDYLSASSGGAAAAAWLAAWLKREGGDPRNVERQLVASRIDEGRATREYLTDGEVVDEEPQPLRHLRSFTDSLFPRAGIVSTDAWIRILTWSRNVVIHLLVLVPLLVLVIAGARIIVSLYGLLERLALLDQVAAQFDSRLGTPIRVLGVLTLALLFLASAVALVLAFSSMAGTVRNFRRGDPRPRPTPEPADSVAIVNRRIVNRVLSAVLLLSLCLPPIRRGLTELIETLTFGPDTGGLLSARTFVDAFLGYVTILGWPNLLAHALLIGGGMAWWTSRSRAGEEAQRRKRLVWASFAAGVTGGLLIVVLETLFDRLVQAERTDLAATLVPAMALLIVTAAVFVLVAVSGRAASDAERAWWAAVSALLTERAICWIAAMTTILYLPGVIFAAGGITRAVAALGWLGAAAIGLLIGRYAGRNRAWRGWPWWLASLGAQVFFVGLLAVTAFFVSLFVNTPSLTAPGGDDAEPFAYYLRGVTGTSIVSVLVFAGGFAIIFVLARRLIDINLFSLDELSIGGLSRCYLGASRPIRAWDNAVVGTTRPAR